MVGGGLCIRPRGGLLVPLLLAGQFAQRNFPPVILKTLFVAYELTFDLVQCRLEGGQRVAGRVLGGGMSDKVVGPFHVDHDLHLDPQPRLHVDGDLNRRHPFEDVQQLLCATSVGDPV